MPLVRVHHLAFRTKQLRRVVRFYRVVLGLRKLREKRANGKIQSAWLDAGGTILMIEAAEEGEPRIPRGTHELVAFALPKGGLARARERLVRHRIHIEDQTDFTIYFRDPDGRRVALSTYLSPKIAGRR